MSSTYLSPVCSVRGITDKTPVLMLVNGVPITCCTSGTRRAQLLPVRDIARVK
jgi:outer membrane cobalamin receptor